MDKTLVLDQLSVWLHQKRVIELSLQVEPGQVVTVMGPSGVGKSTLLGAIAGTLPPAFEVRGEIRLGSRSLGALPTHQRRVGLVFQEPLLFPHMSVAQNLAFGLARHLRARKQLVEQALDEVGLAGLGNRAPHSLSGGQAARVSLQRCLLAQPDVVLLDEPFSKLDARLKAQIRADTFAALSRRNVPTILVTHDREDAAAAKGPIVAL